MTKQKKTVDVSVIGEIVEVIDSKNKTLIGIKGNVIDETKNTITIQTKNKSKKIIKDQITIKIKEKIFKGKNFVGKIETRIKKS